MPKYGEDKKFSFLSIPEVGEKKKKNILQGLGFGPDSATERWPCRKNA